MLYNWNWKDRQAGRQTDGQAGRQALRGQALKIKGTLIS